MSRELLLTEEYVSAIRQAIGTRVVDDESRATGAGVTVDIADSGRRLMHDKADPCSHVSRRVQKFELVASVRTRVAASADVHGSLR